MFRFVSIIVFLLFWLLPLSLSGYPDLKISGEYRQDILDYDDTEKRYYRTGIRLLLTRKSGCNISYIYLKEIDEHRLTWNIALVDVDPSLLFIIGNYTAHFGHGLLFGKKTMMSPDPFGVKNPFSTGSSFSPSNSGNPLYSFYGAVAGYRFNQSGYTVSLIPFYSMRSRFIKEETGSITNSLSSINYHITRDGLYRIPVKINDYGMLLEFKNSNFVLQGYAFYSDLQGENNKDISWNYDDSSRHRGAYTSYYGYGFYMCYGDRYVTIFTEIGVPYRIIVSDGGIKETVYDYGLLYGLIFRHSTVRLSVQGRKSGRNFYGPNSAGHSYSEEGWAVAVTYKPINNLLLDGKFSYKKDLRPSQSDKYLPLTRRESISVVYKLQERENISLRFRTVNRDSNYNKGKYMQFKGSLKKSFFDFWDIKITSIVQHFKKKGTTKSFGISSTVTMFESFKWALHYMRFYISTDDSMYTGSSHSFESATSGFFIKENSNLVTTRISCKYKKNLLQMRYQNLFEKNRTLKWRLELLGVLYW